MTSMQNLTIREATDTDYTALARLATEANPDHPITAESLQHEHQFMRQSTVNPYVNAWLAERNGEALGMALVLQIPGMFHPDRYNVEINVSPEYCRQGIGTALAEMLQEHLQARGAKEVLAGGYEDQPAGLKFLERYGFSEVIRFVDNVLQLEGVNFSDWQEEMRLPDGLRAVTFAALKHELGDEPATRAFYDAFTEARADVPRTAPATALSYDDFRKRFDDPGTQPDLVFLAVSPSGEVTALSELWKSDAGPHRLDIGLTGTRRAWRRKGLALALKLCGMQAAHARGVKELWTGNAGTNQPMLALNERLGFNPRPAYIQMKRGNVE